MDKRALKKLQNSKEFRKLIQKEGLTKRRKPFLLILILLALIIYFIFTRANLYLIIGLTILLVFLMR